MFKHKNKKRVTVYPGNTTSYLDNSNPYIMIDTDDEQLDTETTNSSATPSTPSTLDSRGAIVYLPEDLLQKAKLLEENNCLVRSIIMIDIVMSGLYFLDGLLSGLVCMFISTSGYLATIYYKRSLMICYLAYQYFQVFLRLANVIIIMAIPQQYGYNRTVTTNATAHQNEGYFLNIAVYFLLFVCQTIIACFITKYYKLLPNNEERQRIKSYQHDTI